MTRHVLAIPEDTGIYTASQFMRERQVRRLPVVDREDRLVGIVTLDDLLLFLGRELYNLAEGIKHEMEVKEPNPPLPDRDLSGGQDPEPGCGPLSNCTRIPAKRRRQLP